MAFFINIFTTAATWAGIWGAALVSLARLAGIGIGALAGGAGTAKERIVAKATAPEGLRLALSVLRAVAPNIVLKRVVVKSYPNTGTALATRHADVKDILARNGDFEVVYAPRMEMITGGENFFLGMQDTARYTRDVSNMRLAARREDVAAVIAPLVAQEAGALVAAAKGSIDVPSALALPVAARLVARYFGTPGPGEAAMIDIATTLFWYLFIDLAADPALDVRAEQAAAQLRATLDATIAARKAAPGRQDDVLARCLALQTSGTPGMDDLSIRNNLAGLVIGAIPTTSMACAQALDQLLSRPDALAGAQKAAREGDDKLLAAHVFEAMRFAPNNPVIYRRATRDTVVAAHTLRQRNIPKGTMVMAANLSAMFDPLVLDSPGAFRTDRPWHHYILWGDAQHTCFGAHINAVTIPGILKPLLQKQGLRRVDGAAGQIGRNGTPFPVHFTVRFEP